MNIYTVAMISVFFAMMLAMPILILTWIVLGAAILVWLLYESEMLPQSIIDTIENFRVGKSGVDDRFSKNGEPERFDNAAFRLADDNLIYGKHDSESGQKTKHIIAPVVEKKSDIEQVDDALIIATENENSDETDVENQSVNCDNYTEQTVVDESVFSVQSDSENEVDSVEEMLKRLGDKCKLTLLVADDSEPFTVDFEDALYDEIWTYAEIVQTVIISRSGSKITVRIP